MERTTLVVFRRWRDNGDIIALFPEIPSDINGHFCEAYEHVGQHGGADCHGVIQATRPATGEEVHPGSRTRQDRLQPPAHQAGFAQRPRAPTGHGTSAQGTPGLGMCTRTQADNRRASSGGTTMATRQITDWSDVKRLSGSPATGGILIPSPGIGPTSWMTPPPG